MLTAVLVLGRVPMVGAVEEDPLAAFGVQLQQVTRAADLTSPIPQGRPSDAASPANANSKLDTSTSVSPNGGLLDAIEQAKSKKRVDPRTHG